MAVLMLIYHLLLYSNVTAATFFVISLLTKGHTLLQF